MTTAEPKRDFIISYRLEFDVKFESMLNLQGVERERERERKRNGESRVERSDYNVGPS